MERRRDAAGHDLIYRTVRGGHCDLLATSAVSNNTDSSVVTGTMYLSVVGAMDANGLLRLNFENWALANRGVPAVPTGLTARLSAGPAVLDRANSPAVINYGVYRSVSSGSGYTQLNWIPRAQSNCRHAGQCEQQQLLPGQFLVRDR